LGINTKLLSFGSLAALHPGAVAKTGSGRGSLQPCCSCR